MAQQGAQQHRPRVRCSAASSGRGVVRADMGACVRGRRRYWQHAAMSCIASTWAKASPPDRRRPSTPPTRRQGWSGRTLNGIRAF